MFLESTKTTTEQVVGLEPTLFQLGRLAHHQLCVTCNNYQWGSTVTLRIPLIFSQLLLLSQLQPHYQHPNPLQYSDGLPFCFPSTSVFPIFIICFYKFKFWCEPPTHDPCRYSNPLNVSQNFHTTLVLPNTRVWNSTEHQGSLLCTQNFYI